MKDELVNFIGLSCTGHDNALCIVDSFGEVVFCEATERYLQNKRSYNSPPDDINRISALIEKYCDPNAALVVSKSWSDETKAKFQRERELFATRFSESKDQSYYFSHYILDFIENTVQNSGPQIDYRCGAGSGRSLAFKNFEHHLTHAAAACYSSPFDQCVCVIVDALGECRTTSVYSFENGLITELSATETEGNLFKSLGMFYGNLCEACGFNSWAGEEWKVMGLAAYGKFDEEIYNCLCSLIKVDGLDLICPESESDMLKELSSFSRKEGQSPLAVADLAYTGQQVFGELMTQLLTNAHGLGISDNLVLGGGCALNSSYNGQALSDTPFKQLHVAPAPGDDGNALGAALLAYHHYSDFTPDHQKTTILSPYLGSTMSADQLEKCKLYSGLPFFIADDSSLISGTASALADGMIVGWVQGQAEFGPRALGNRSLLADPRESSVKDRINSQVKFREEFRPFAPSILAEYGDDYFEDFQLSPYMERTLLFRPEVRSIVPGVVHEDGTGRLQTVTAQINERYYNLLSSFHEITGVPILLNTSFNVMGKPIVHFVEDVLSVFLTSRIDLAVIENTIFAKSENSLKHFQ